MAARRKSFPSGAKQARRDTMCRPPRPPRIPDRLMVAYLTTQIQICGSPEWMDDRHVITAFNPMSEDRPLEENRAANRELEAALLDTGRKYCPAVNRSPEGDWEEPGFAIEGLTREEARELGRRFGQYAVFEIGRHELRVVACFEERVEVIPALPPGEPPTHPGTPSDVS